jgi:cysteinyl-tRNA synthetase
MQVEPHFGDTIRFYTCGPTVYDFAHIGNLRTFVAEDLMKRAMLFFGMRVKHVMNLTDVDDKTIRGSLKAGMSLANYTKQYKNAFFEDLKTLNVLPADCFPEATQYIQEMIQMTEKLLQKKVAYEGQDGSIYFSIAHFPSYGKLSHLKLDELVLNKEGLLQHDEYTKENLADFVLWKSYDPERDGTVYWESPFGKGRPGWHLECSVMAGKELGEEIDIHAGGVDLIFPHHENEIAQSEACCDGTTFSNMWVHVEHLLVDQKKMSKSLGNFYTLRDLLQKGYNGRTVRLMLLQTHYRMQMNFTLQTADAAKNTLHRIDDFLLRLQEYEPIGKESHHASLKRTDEAFRYALAHDLNISEALSHLFELIREMNGLIDAKQLSSKDKESLLSLLKQFDQVLGLMHFDKEKLPVGVEKLLEERAQVRREKNFKRSDEIRQELIALGYTVEDTPTGARVKYLL